MDPGSAVAAATCPGATTTYGYNTANELTSTNGSGTGWSYNLNGLEGDGNSALPRSSETYTGSNALKTVTVGGTAYTATYGGVGNDLRLTFNNLTYTSGQLGLAYQTDGTTLVAFTHDTAGTLVSERTGGNSYYYIYDGQGSVINLINNAGIAQDTYSYDPYGGVRTHTGTLINPIGYTGARYCDPALVRFTQPDPSGSESNRFTYVSANPVNSVDPTGRCSGLLWTFATDFILGSFGGAVCGALIFGLGGPEDPVGDHLCFVAIGALGSYVSYLNTP